jgi:uncharacterized glyoxalase superfamily protein PhnB
VKSAGAMADSKEGTFPAEEQLIVEIYVANLKESIQYFELYGFKPLRTEEKFAELKWGASKSVLFLEEVEGYRSVTSDAGHQGLAANVRVMVSDVDQYYAIAKTHGHRLITEIQDRYYGLRDFTVAGPDGIGLRFASLLDKTH